MPNDKLQQISSDVPVMTREEISFCFLFRRKKLGNFSNFFESQNFFRLFFIFLATRLGKRERRDKHKVHLGIRKLFDENHDGLSIEKKNNRKVISFV